MKLGVNVDHAATLREARGTEYPDPVFIAKLAEYAGCNSIVMHLREDRRHVKERDVILAQEVLDIPLNLEMSVDKGIVDFAVTMRPVRATLVPERRKELTTEGGLNITKHFKRIEKAVDRLRRSGVKVSLFIDPLKKEINAAKKLSVDSVEFNTGRYSEAKTAVSAKREAARIKSAVESARDKRIHVAAGHGLGYQNVKQIVKIGGIDELNIGHSIICRSLAAGTIAAVEEMLSLLEAGKRKNIG